MKIIFMGTPAFAIESLRMIYHSGHEVSAVVTAPDKPCGRGRRIEESAVKQAARELNLTVYQPEKLTDPIFLTQMAELRADLMVVVAFRILPVVAIQIPRLGAINLHASLLPRYRGAAPIQWALINGDRVTGVSIFQIEPTVDTGRVILQRETAINDEDTAGSLAFRLAHIGAEALLEALDQINRGVSQPLEQDERRATTAPKIKPELGAINWHCPAIEIRRLIHGLSPQPGAYSHLKGQRIRFLQAAVSSEMSGARPGEIIVCGKRRLGIQTGSGILWPLQLQIEGRNAHPVQVFMCGFQGKTGDRFED